MRQDSHTPTPDTQGNEGLFSDAKAPQTYALYAGVSAVAAVGCILIIVGTNGELSIAFVVAVIVLVVGFGAGVLAVVTALRRRSHLMVPVLSLVAVALAVAAVAAMVIQQPRRPRCPGHLRQIGQGLMWYALDHQQQCPNTLQELVTLGHIEPEVLVCPFNKSGGDTSLTSYVYLKPKRSFDKILADEVLAYEPLRHHEVGGNVLFGDGHVEWFDALAYERILAEAAAITRRLDDAAVTRPATRPDSTR